MNAHHNRIWDRAVLDQGYVRLIESWGGGDYTNSEYCSNETEEDKEAGIIEAARQSTQGSFRGWEQDEKLLKHLYTNKHMTPFEFAGMVIEVQAPIFVFREWHRHRTQSYNEMSARYAPLPDLNYLPTIDRIMLNPGRNTQAKGINDALTMNNARDFRVALQVSYDEAEKRYQESLSLGIPKELARCFLPVGRYSKMRASANLRNWLQFLTLRMDPNAQWEIQQYARAVAGIVEYTFPKVYKLFTSERSL